MEKPIGPNSTVSLSLVITLVGLAFGIGAFWMKMTSFETRLIAVEDSVKVIHNYIIPPQKVSSANTNISKYE